MLFIAIISEDTVDSAEDKEDLRIPGTALLERQASATSAEWVSLSDREHQTPKQNKNLQPYPSMARNVSSS